MKYRTTDKEQRQNKSLVLAFGYCDIQNIEKYINPQAYTAGVYGWRADFYEFDGFTISTGYAPLNWLFDKKDKAKAEFIKAEIRKLDKYLEKARPNWEKGKAYIYKKINAIYKKACELYHE